jgi:serine/threonine-protein kinase
MQTAMDSTGQQVVPEIGKYHLVAELARGGMGVVYLAAAQGPGGFSKLLVVKELRPEFAQDESYVAMFLDEARLAAQLTHRNIVQTIEVGSEGNRHYMVMEFLDGRSLQRIARRFADRGTFPVGAHLRIIAESLLGLHYAHELRGFDGEPLGIVHRDVSPLNVVVTFDGQVKVIDFGIAKSVESTHETKTGVLKGRVAYMAPEQAWGQPVDRRADVYAAGVMIWEAVTGKRLWEGKNDVEILAKLLREGAPPLRAVLPNISPELDALCARAMARDPAERQPSAAALLDELETHLAGRSDAMTMRDVGGLVSAVFAEERRRMNTLIEETLVRVRSASPASGVMPTLENRSHAMPSGGLFAVGAMSAFGEPSQSAMLSLGSGRIAVSLPPSASASAAPAELEHVPWWRTRRAALLGGAAGTLAILAAVAAAMGHGDPAPAAPPSSTAGAAVAVAPAAPEMLDLLVRVSPASAQISLDGVPLASNPFRGRFPRDGLAHHVGATAEGYDAKLEDVTFAGDVSIDVSLDRRAAPAVRWIPSVPLAAAPAPVHSGKHAAGAASAPPADSAPPPAPPPPAPARTDVGPAGGHAPLRPIMTSNPYGSP